jgi:hypothetical protein
MQLLLRAAARSPPLATARAAAYLGLCQKLIRDDGCRSLSGVGEDLHVSG